MAEAAGTGGDGQAAAAPDPGSEAPRDFQTEADEHLERLLESLSPSEAALALTVLANRAAVRLHNLTKAEAANAKGRPEWPSWAGLQNAARNLTLQTSASRDVAARLAGRRR